MTFPTHAVVVSAVLLAISTPTVSAQQDEPENAVEYRSQRITVAIDPGAHHARITAGFDVRGTGQAVFRISRDVILQSVHADGLEMLHVREPLPNSRHDRVSINLTGDETTVTIFCEGVFDDDYQAGEIAGEIHNHAVNAFIGEEGVFLSEGSAWHPQPIDDVGVHVLVPTALAIEPVEGWSFVASGQPAAGVHHAPTDAPIHEWTTPRGVPGVAIVGGRHASTGRIHQTAYGPVAVVAQFSDATAAHAETFIDAACRYLDLYVPLLGPFPYERFTMVENFFSSGFAFPGFTLLGPRVVAMGHRAADEYGYLDHELVHNWWGNGVYVDPSDGNWCEGLTTYCANYYRRIADDGEAAGREYRRNTLMKLSGDPAALDNAPIDAFGRESNVDRFVGYDKAAFVFMMLEHGPGMPGFETDRSQLFAALMRFAHTFKGEYASWDDLRAVIEETYGESREAFFQHWVREHHTPMTPERIADGGIAAFMAQYTGDEIIDLRPGRNDEGTWMEIDPDFRAYRAMPPAFIIPTIAGTFGKGAAQPVTHETRAEVETYLSRFPMPSAQPGENLLLIGREAIEEHQELLRRAQHAITLTESGFVVDGDEYAEPDMAVLHTMPHPDRPGRFMTVFHSNGDAGWSRLRLINFYTRDSTIIWEGESVVQRITFEPPRRTWRD